MPAASTLLHGLFDRPSLNFLLGSLGSKKRPGWHFGISPFPLPWVAAGWVPGAAAPTLFIDELTVCRPSSAPKPPGSLLPWHRARRAGWLPACQVRPRRRAGHERRGGMGGMPPWFAFTRFALRIAHASLARVSEGGQAYRMPRPERSEGRWEMRPQMWRTGTGLIFHALGPNPFSRGRRQPPIPQETPPCESCSFLKALRFQYLGIATSASFPFGLLAMV